jgi:dihydrofolate synthase/folylpolyglutamate synthase
MADLDSASLLKTLGRLHPKSIDLSLDRVERLLAALGHPERAVPPVVHIAGTNGKGSTVAFLRAILEAAGYRVHAFISPHLRTFHERILLANGTTAAPIAEDALVDVLSRAEKANGDAPVTFFEITCAAALLAYAEYPADVLILETGLGGRLDATNVFEQPLATVITPISVDHTSFLGNSLKEIAGEKAGIIKPGVPCVVARQEEEAFNVIAAAAVRKAPLFAAGIDWDVYKQHGRLVFQDANGLIDLPPPRLAGGHQVQNAGLALATARLLKSYKLTEEHFARGLTSAAWRARLERLGPGALYEIAPPGAEIWVDGGHNPGAGEVLSRALADLEDRVPCPLHLIVGMMSTKDASGFLSHFKGLTEFVATIGIPGQPNAYTAEELASMARHSGLFAEPAASLKDAFALSKGLARGPVRVLITGSLYLAGHILDAHEHGLSPV